MNTKFKLGDVVVKEWGGKKFLVDEVYLVTSEKGLINHYEYHLAGDETVNEDNLELVGARPFGNPLQINDCVRIVTSSGWGDTGVIIDKVYRQREGEEKQLEGFLLNNKKIVSPDEVVYWGTLSGEIKDGV